MTKNRNQLTMTIFAASMILTQASGVFAFSGGFDYFDNFPAMCSEASDRHPLRGHTIRLGFIAETSFGWSFLFPERQSQGMLERVQLLDNVGLIGQHPDQDLSGSIHFRTPAGYFIVAHVFVGDPNIEPLVTCVSAPIPIAQFAPLNYGTNFSWLDAGQFGTWLSYRKYGKWRWRTYWNFDKIRTGFRSYWKDERINKFRKFERYRKFRRHHDGRKFRRDDDDRKFRRDDDGRKFRWTDGGKPRDMDDYKKRFDKKKPITIMPVDDDDDGKPKRDRGGWRKKDTTSGSVKMPGLTSPKDFSPSDKRSTPKKGWTTMKRKGPMTGQGPSTQISKIAFQRKSVGKKPPKPPKVAPQQSDN